MKKIRFSNFKYLERAVLHNKPELCYVLLRQAPATLACASDRVILL
jgi:hypothetical protein